MPVGLFVGFGCMVFFFIFENGVYGNLVALVWGDGYLGIGVCL